MKEQEVPLRRRGEEGRRGGREPPLGEALGGDAVSYTHLRAHETVLDLVCRLLLEKKKNKTKKKN